MKVLILGGTGVFGKSVAVLLAKEKLITSIGLASRHFIPAQQAASEIGDKAHAVCVDIKDLSRLSSIAVGYDIIVNAAGPTSEVQVPAIQAAMEAGVHYCDLTAIGTYAERALQLNSQAQNRGITAIIATGWAAILNLMAVHALHQLDLIEQLSVCCLFDYTPGDFFSP
jgi:saccharopine dehydrogenase-like NADP-dependent oxidoreductase